MSKDSGYVEAKKGMLKALANKMYKMELEEHKKGCGPKPKPVPKAMEEKNEDVAKQSPKVSNHVKSMVQNFFREKKSNDKKNVTAAGYVKRKPTQVAAKVEDKPKRKRPQ